MYGTILYYGKRRLGAFPVVNKEMRDVGLLSAMKNYAKLVGLKKTNCCIPSTMPFMRWFAHDCETATLSV